MAHQLNSTERQSANSTANGRVGTVLFFSRPRSEGWPRHGRTFSIYARISVLSFWLILPRRVLSTSSCCPSRPCVAFLVYVHLALFLALSLSPGNSLVFSWYDHGMLASLLWRCLTVPSLLQLYPLVCFLCYCETRRIIPSPFMNLKDVKTRFFILSESPAFTAVRCYRPC